MPAGKSKCNNNRQIDRDDAITITHVRIESNGRPIKPEDT
jgi:hypothetical protein